MRTDLHIHSVYSDGRRTPRELARLAAKRGVTHLSLTDHDTLLGLPAMRMALAELANPPAFLAGVELTCNEDGQRVDLLGYGIREDCPALANRLAARRRARGERALRMLELLRRQGVVIPPGLLIRLAAAPTGDAVVPAPSAADASAFEPPVDDMAVLAPSADDANAVAPFVDDMAAPVPFAVDANAFAPPVDDMAVPVPFAVDANAFAPPVDDMVVPAPSAADANAVAPSADNAAAPQSSFGITNPAVSPEATTKPAEHAPPRGERAPVSGDMQAADATTIGRPHVARALVLLGYARDVKDAFARYLGEGKPGYLPNEPLPLREGIALILSAGGLPVLAHPTRLRMPLPDALALIERQIPLGLRGVEAYHASATGSQARELAAFARERDLLVTGGSDYHGDANVPLHIGDTAPGWRTMEADTERVFAESACRRT